MLRVLCSTSELDEHGESIAVGDMVSRLAAPAITEYYGTELDSIAWHFDRYADFVGAAAVTIQGHVITISAIYVHLTREGESGWTARLDSAHLEPLTTTAATRRIKPTIDWQPAAPSGGRSHSHGAVGHRHIAEGDEDLSGWVITLEPAGVEPHH